TTLKVPQLAALDQFHSRGLLATSDLADAMQLAAGMTVLDLGCGIGGPARHLAASYDVQVTGIDLSPSYVDAARYLSQRCGLAARTAFTVGVATRPPMADSSVDRVFLLHVAMNIADRIALYQAIRRVLKPGGRFASYDIVAKAGAPYFPLPWATTPDESHLLNEADTRAALLTAGFAIDVFRDDTELVKKWFATTQASGPAPGPNLGLLLGANFPVMVGNLARSLREGL